MDYQKVIEQGRKEFLVNSWSFIFWGVVGSIIPTLILILRYWQNNDANFLLLGFPLAGVFSTIVIVRYAIKNHSTNPITWALSFLWGFVSVNVIIVAFGVPLLYDKLLIATVFLMLGIAQSTCGVLIQLRALIVSGVLMVVEVWAYLFFLAFYKAESWRYDFLIENLDMFLLILLSCSGQLIPGWLIRHSK